MIYRSPLPDVEIPHVPLTPFVLQHAAHLGTKPAFIDASSGRTLTYGELADGVQRVASGLARRGFQKGDVLAICSPNIPEYPLAFHAAVSLGGIVTGINPMWTAGEIAHQLVDSGARYLLTTPDALDRALEAAARSDVREVFVIGEDPRAMSFATLLADNGSAAPDVHIDAREDLAALPYSSGTSGLPKGVMLTHRSLVAGLCQFTAAESVSENEVVLTVPPFFHMYGMCLMSAICLQSATIVTVPRFDIATCLRSIEGYGVTRAHLLPPIVLNLANEPLVGDYDLSTLRLIHCGAAPLGEEVGRRVTARLGCPIKQGYALTECYPAMRMMLAAPGMDDCASVGRCVPNTECRVVDPVTGSDVEPGQPGELWLRGPQVMKGYLHRPDATAEVLDADGWLRTGDIGRADAEGHVTIVDRLKELIKVKGYQVAPAELEAVLLSHPAVADAAVIPIPNEGAGELPKAFVVLKEDSTAEDIMIFVAARVAPYKKVRRVEFVDQIPKSASGKILRRVLVERERASSAVLV
jgi:acyl-CoA synthetase (AMP-forming)/AMP-acid ligase II